MTKRSGCQPRILATLLGPMLLLASVGVASAGKPLLIGPSGVRGVMVRDSLHDVVRKLQGCELRLVPSMSEGLPQVSIAARCGARVTMEVEWDSDSQSVYRITVTGGNAATARGLRVGDDVRKAVRLYGAPIIGSAEGSVCLTFSSAVGIGFCLSRDDAHRYLQKLGGLESEEPPLEGHIDSILVFGEGKR